VVGQVNAQKTFPNRTSDELLSVYGGHTALQADKLIEPYKGMWIKAQGSIELVLPSEDIAVLFRQGADAIE
jgi:hypothetical protein